MAFYVTGLKQKQTSKIVGRLNFKCPSWYLNFNVLFMKNIIIIWVKKIKLWNKWHFMENKSGSTVNFLDA